MGDFNLIEYLRGKVPDEMLRPRDVSPEEKDIILSLVEESIKKELS